MQQDFDTNYPELDIHIVGINELGQEVGNTNITEPMPWLQDVDADGDSQGDVWTLWDVEWRDLTILGRDNVPLATYNLTNLDLADPDTFAEVRQAFLSIAMTGAVPAGEGEDSSAGSVLEDGTQFPQLVDQALAAQRDWLSASLLGD